MFGFIKNLFSGIIAFFSGLFGGKKSQNDASAAPKAKKSKGYFLELDDTGNAKTEAETKKPEVAKIALATAEPPKAEKPKAEQPKVQQSDAPQVTVPSAAQNGKVEQVKVEAQPNPPATNVNGKVSAAAEGTFAPKYLIPTPSSSRRRPGPSMDMFRDMARQVKTPS